MIMMITIVKTRTPTKRKTNYQAIKMSLIGQNAQNQQLTTQCLIRFIKHRKIRKNSIKEFKFLKLQIRHLLKNFVGISKQKIIHMN